MPPIDDVYTGSMTVMHLNRMLSLYPNLIRLGFNNYSEYLEMPSKTTEAWENGAEVCLKVL